VTSSKAAELAMKRRVCVFTTGGTIATRVDEYGIARLGTSTIENLLAHADAEVEIEMKSLMDKESANLIPSDWKVLAKESARIIVRGEVDGIVILHGTDTMHYTAAALSFMVQNPGIPIVLTGSMVPGSDPKSDAISNFQAALQIASESSIAEVCIVFSSNPGGRKKVVLRGCRARKVRSIRLNAFESVNLPPLAYVQRKKINYTGVSHAKRESYRMSLNVALEENVAYVKQSPALTCDVLESCLHGVKGAVIEGTGKGHVNERLLPVLESFGHQVVISTQALYDGEQFGSYNIGSKMLKLENLVHARDMTSETALVKLMWCLGHKGSVKRVFLRNICGEISTEQPRH
jgi:glutamyl-tRNA(Gln) amidotransferase subunit D